MRHPAPIARTNGRCAVWPVCGSYQVAAAQDLAALASTGSASSGRTGRMWSDLAWPSRRQEEPRRAEDPIGRWFQTRARVT